MSREDFEGLRDHCRQRHERRVADTPRRIEYAKKRLAEEGLEFRLLNIAIGHFHIISKRGDVIDFWAGTGKIKGHEEERGIEAVIKIATEVENG